MADNAVQLLLQFGTTGEEQVAAAQKATADEAVVQQGRVAEAAEASAAKQIAATNAALENAITAARRKFDVEHGYYTQLLESIRLASKTGQKAFAEDFVATRSLARRWTLMLEEAYAAHAKFLGGVRRGNSSLLSTFNRLTSALRTLFNSFSRHLALVSNYTNAGGRLLAIFTGGGGGAGGGAVAGGEAAAGGVAAGGGLIGATLGFAAAVGAAAAAIEAANLGLHVYAAEKAAKYIDTVGKMSAATGMSTQAISGLMVAAKEAGVEVSVVERSLAFFTRGLGKATDTNTPFNQSLKALGITSRDATTAFGQVADKLGKMEEGSRKNAIATALFSRVSGEAAIETLRFVKAIGAVSGGMQEWIRVSRELGMEVLPNQLNAAQALLVQQRTLKIEFDAFFMKMGTEFIPTLQVYIAALENIGLAIKTVVAYGKALAEAAITIQLATHGQIVAAVEMGKKTKQAFDDAGKAHQEFQNAMVRSIASANGLAKALSNLSGKEAPEWVSKAKDQATATDRLAEMLRTARDRVQSYADSSVPALQRIDREYANHIHAADEALAHDEDLYKHHKINLAELEKRESEYTAFVKAQTQIKAAEIAKEVSTWKTRTQIITGLIDKEMAVTAKSMEQRVRAQEAGVAAEKQFASTLEGIENRLQEANLDRQRRLLQTDLQMRRMISTRAKKDLEGLIEIERQKTFVQAQEATRRIRDAQQEFERKLNTEKQHLVQMHATEAELKRIDDQIAASRKKAADDITTTWKQQAQAAQDYADAAQKAAKAQEIADAEAVASGLSRLLATVGHQRAAALVNAVMETAAAFASFAIGDIKGGVLHSLSAAEYYVAAGQAGKTASAAGAGTETFKDTTTVKTTPKGTTTTQTESTTVKEPLSGSAGVPTNIDTLQVGTLVVTNLAVSNLIDGMNKLVLQNDKFLLATRARQPNIPGM